MNQNQQNSISFPTKLQPFVKELFNDSSIFRYLVLYGGRGGGKSESVARALITLSLQKKIRILCAREYQTSIRDSVHKILKDIIDKYELKSYFHITEASIKSAKGSEFIFKGIANDPDQIKSLQGVDVCWVEESQRVSNRSLDCLIPTIRNKGAKIIFTFNPALEDDPVYDRFIKHKNENVLAIKINYNDNPWIKDTALIDDIKRDKTYFPEKYNNIWLGETIKINDALVFAGHYIIEPFKEPDPRFIFENRFFYGIDFGFKPDPIAFVRCFIEQDRLFIDYEAGGTNISLDNIEIDVLEKIPLSKEKLIFGDCASPHSIDFIRRRGYNIEPAKKGADSIKAGIDYIKNFKKIVIHPRCENVIDNFKTYSHKIDKVSDKILPEIADKNNDYIDAIRYALNDYIFSNSFFMPFFMEY